MSTTATPKKRVRKPAAATATKSKATPAKAADAKKPGRPATPLNVGSTWKRRTDDKEVKVVSIDEKGGKIQLQAAGSKTPTISKLVFFRRRFQHVKG
jgi:hypothetical protein